MFEAKNHDPLVFKYASLRHSFHLVNRFYSKSLSSLLSPEMQNKDSNSLQQPADGICQRFFNFIMSSLVARSLKRVKTGDHVLRREPNEILLAGSSRNSEETMHSPASDSEIVVEFRHKAVASEGKAAGKRVAFIESEETNKRPEKRVQTEKLPPPPPEVAVDEDGTEVRLRRRVSLTNINSKSDEFIRRKKADLSRTTSIEKL